MNAAIQINLRENGEGWDGLALPKLKERNRPKSHACILRTENILTVELQP